MKKILLSKKDQRARRTRAKIRGTAERPRLSVFRSNQHFYAQLIDDTKGVTLAAVSDKELGNKVTHITVEMAKDLGARMAKAAQDKGVKAVVFDRGSYRYHGRVEAFATGAREGGLDF